MKMNARIIAPHAKSTISNEMYDACVKNLEAFVEDIIKDVYREAETNYITIIKNEILDKMEEVDEDDNEYVEECVEEAIIDYIRPWEFLMNVQGVFDRIKSDLYDFISKYWLLSNDNIIEIQNVLKYFLNEFARNVKYGIHDWFVTSIDSSFIPDVIKIEDIDNIITNNIMPKYYTNIIESANTILPQCLRSAYSYLDLYTYYDDEIVKKIDENYKSIEFKYEKYDFEESEDEV